MEYLPFRVAGRDFVVDASRVRAIVPYEGSQEYHGVPVVDLRKRLGLPDAVHRRRQLLVMLESAGFLADYVSDIVRGSAKDCRNGKLRAGGRPKWILDPDSLLIARGAAPVSS